MQVKIWFQNRRSKFKKLWKSGEIPPEQHVASSESPPHPSPPLNTTWDFAHSQRMNTVNVGLPQSSSPPNTTTPSFLTNYPWYSSTNSATHLQPLHHPNTTISAGTIFWLKPLKRWESQVANLQLIKDLYSCIFPVCHVDDFQCALRVTFSFHATASTCRRTQYIQLFFYLFIWFLGVDSNPLRSQPLFFQSLEMRFGVNVAAGYRNH